MSQRKRPSSFTRTKSAAPTKSSNASEAVAIVGMGCRFPGAPNVDAFWQLLCEGRHAIREVPRERFDISRYYSADPGEPGKICTRMGGFIDHVDAFDAEFFRVSPRHAQMMDPQQRVGLEVAYEATEDAGLRLQELQAHTTGVFLGLHASDYAEGLSDTDLDVEAAVGVSRSAAAGRLCFALGLKGPSMVVDSDRSSSLVAAHLACRSLLDGDCDFALAGGTNLILSPRLSIAFSRSGLLSPEGLCKFCDSDAQGFVRSDGVGFVMLQRLSDAVAQGRRIYAVIRGGAVNADGGRSRDFITPSRESQEALLREAYRNAGVRPADVGYVEAHGTGTVVGDPVELSALGAVLREGRAAKAPCMVGSVKTNIGHTEAAAGIAGLIKTALVLKHGRVPATLHIKRPNPKIPFKDLLLRLPTEGQDWPTRARRCAGVTSLGLTGINAHVVLEQAPEAARLPLPENERSEMVVLSATHPEAMTRLAESYVEFLERAADTVPLRDMAHKAAVLRARHGERMVAVVNSPSDLRQTLQTVLRGEDAQNVARGVAATKTPRVAFVFPGQGGQWLGMGRDLTEQEPAFREVIEACDAALRKAAGWSLLKELRASPKASRLAELDVLQPALTAVQMAMAALWRSWGVLPDAVIGTSMGEVAAAYVAGVLTADQAMRVALARSTLLKRIAGKGMLLVVGVGAEAARALIKGHEDKVACAVFNSPGSSVLSGDTAVLERVMAELKAKDIFTQPIRNGIASHSMQVDPLLGELTRKLAKVRGASGTLPLYSTVETRRVDGTAMDADYWCRNLRQPVCFSATLEAMLGEGFDVFVDMSPHPTLVGPALDVIAAGGYDAVALGSTRRDASERRELLLSAAHLHVRGVNLDFTKVTGQGNIVTLPTHPWHRQRYWRDITPLGARPASSETLETPAPMAAPAEAAVPTGGGRLTDRLLAATDSQRLELMQDHVRQTVAKVLGFETERLPVTRSFREMGLTSLGAAQVCQALSRALGRTLPPSLPFNHPNVVALAKALVEGRLGARQSDRGAAPTVAAVSQPSQTANEPLAVIGMACRFPQADSPKALWRLLSEGVDAITEVPANRWDADALYDANITTPGKMVSRWGGFIDGIDLFDARFFGISPREAEDMDPAQRLLLEVAWQALENAGQAPATLNRTRTGVYIGMSNYNDYATLKHLNDEPARVHAHHGTGNAMSIAAGRLAYQLGAQGPAMTVDTACSSSLVALHLAAQSLRHGESNMAIVGGVNVILSPEQSLAFSKAGMLSPDGRCKTFDQRANGYVRSEGCGVIVLKRLADALRDQDCIVGLIAGTAINQDGRSSGLTAPNGQAQQDLLRAALAAAHLQPSDVDYVEAHGTGTPLGDPIEVESIGGVYGKGRQGQAPLWVGSVKTNVGHLEAAAGMAGLIKTLLTVNHKQIPASLHFEKGNKLIDFAGNHVMVPTRLIPWEAKGPRRAGVSSFGFSGTNAHAIVQEPPAAATLDAATSTRPSHLLIMSATERAPLENLARAYMEHLEHTDANLADVCFTASAGRSHFAHRLAVTGGTAADMRAKLQAFVDGNTDAETVSTALETDAAPKVAFLFSGQGAQDFAMGRRLYEVEPVFRAALDRCAALLKPHMHEALLDLLYGNPQQEQRIHATANTQPALFAVEYALAQVWQAWGVQPSVLLGHSIGEYVAACVAGVFSVEDALKLVAARGALMGSLPEGGTMMAVSASMERIQEVLGKALDTVDCAAINGPEDVVLSGDKRRIEALCEKLTAGKVRNKMLTVSHAFHSRSMEPILAEFEKVAASVTYNKPRIPIASNVTGALAQEDDLMTPRYWVQHLRGAVQFKACVDTVIKMGVRVFVELGPKMVLSAMARTCAPNPSLVWLGSMRSKADDWSQMQRALAGLYGAGVGIDWVGVYRGMGCQRTPLPTYPFDRQSYWIGGPLEAAPARASAAQVTGGAALHPFLGRRRAGKDIVFESEVSAARPAFIEDHKIHGLVIVPAVGYLEMAMRATRELFDGAMGRVESVAIHQGMIVAPGTTRLLRLTLKPAVQNTYSFEIQSCETTEVKDPSAWRVHCTGTLAPPIALEVPDPLAVARIGELQKPLKEHLDREKFYKRTHRHGIGLGPDFFVVDRVWRSDVEILAHLTLPTKLVAEMEQYLLHPVFLDAGWQLLATPQAQGKEPRIPMGLGRLTYHDLTKAAAWVHIHYESAPTDDTTVARVTYYNEDGAVVAAMTGCRSMKVPRQALARLVEAQVPPNWFFEMGWKTAEPVALPAKAAGDAPATWLVFDAAGTLGPALVDALGQRGAKAMLVKGADVNGASRDDFDKLVQKAVAGGSSPLAGAICLFDVREKTSGALDPTLCAPALHLTQALAAAKLKKARLWLVTRGAQVLAEDKAPCSIGQATLWGFGRVVALEHSDLWGGLVDLDPTTATSAEDEASRLVREIYDSTGGASAEQIAWRAKQRFVARMQPTTLPANRARFAADPNGTYLITGGLGGLGLKVAQWLVMQGAGGLVLVGRGGTLPEKMRPVVDQWQQAGVQVTVEALDVADRRAVDACIARMQAAKINLKGIVHAAGVLEDAMVMQQTWSRFEKSFAAKVGGAWNLHQATEHLSLDLFVLFSSVAAVLGMPGQVNYAAANAALDALAHHRKARGLPALSINWGQWSEVGMAADALARQASPWTQRGLGIIPPAQGVTAMGQALESRLSQVALSPVDWPKLGEAMVRPPLLTEFIKAGAAAQKGVGTHVQGTLVIDKLAAMAPAERRAQIAKIASDVLCNILGLPTKTTLPPRQALKDQGLDSMLAITLRNALGTEFGHPMPATLAFDYPTLEALTKFLEQELPFHEAGKDSGLSDEANKSEELREMYSLLTQIESQYSKAEVEKLLASLV